MESIDTEAPQDYRSENSKEAGDAGYAPKGATERKAAKRRNGCTQKKADATYSQERKGYEENHGCVFFVA